jgi:ABC-type transport system involved in multi-copper enzyme maturation permease subunit
MNSFWPIILITYKEGIRNRAIYGVAMISLLLLFFSFLLCGMLMRDVGKVAVDFALATISLSGLLVVLFSSINMMNKDVERKTIYMVLSRPVSHSQYLLGKFFGLAFLLAVTVGMIGVAGCGTIWLVELVYPVFSQGLSWPLIILAIFFNYLSLLLLLALSFLFFSFSSNSFIVLILTVMTYLIGNSLRTVKDLIESTGTLAIDVSQLTKKIVLFAYYFFPNLSFFNIKIQAAHALKVPFDQILWSITYGLFYCAAVMVAACLIFRRREFP